MPAVIQFAMGNRRAEDSPLYHAAIEIGDVN
jgi:hypothetical protein